MLDVVLCIENRIYREGLANILTKQIDVDEVTVCSELEQLEHLLGGREFDVILIEKAVENTRCNAVDAIKTAYRAANGRPVVALGLDEGDDEILRFAEAGAAAFVTKNDAIADLVGTIRAAASGEMVCPPRIVRLMQERLAHLSCTRESTSGLEKLSQREFHILRLIEETMSNKQIARELGLEVSTIKNHVHNIIVKLSVHSRAEAATVLRLAVGAQGVAGMMTPAPARQTQMSKVGV